MSEVKVYQTIYEKTISGFGLGLDVSAKHTLFIDYNLDDKNKSEVLMPLKLVLKSDYDELTRQNKILKEALEFYRKKKSWKWSRLVNGGETNDILDDGGAKADEALKSCGGGGGV